MTDSAPPDVWQAHLECLKRREPFSCSVFARRAPDGIKWMRASGMPVLGDGGIFQGYCGSASDITAEIEAAARPPAKSAPIPFSLCFVQAIHTLQAR